MDANELNKLGEEYKSGEKNFMDTSMELTFVHKCKPDESIRLINHWKEEVLTDLEAKHKKKEITPHQIAGILQKVQIERVKGVRFMERIGIIPSDVAEQAIKEIRAEKRAKEASLVTS